MSTSRPEPPLTLADILVKQDPSQPGRRTSTPDASMASHDEKVDTVHDDLVTQKDTVLAKQAAEDEHNLSIIAAIRKYPKAVLWSALLSTSIIMEGYDIVLMGSFFAQPSFSARYGDYDAVTGTYQISASWQNGLSNAVSIGTIIGAFANGYFTHKFGYRKVLLASLGLITAFIFIPFFAPNLPVLLIGEFLCGIPWGVFATMVCLRLPKREGT
jgi:SP family general alpha glucoside:H+ symporter-like MFS transporter